MLVHGDWRIENANVAAGEVVAIYDWDSVCVEPELFAVATAAVTFCVDWSRPVGEHFPTNAEIRAFIGEYETARGAPFSDAQRAPPRGAHGLRPLLRRASANTPTTSRRSPTRSRRSYAASATRCSITDWTRCGPDKTNRRG